MSSPRWATPPGARYARAPTSSLSSARAVRSARRATVEVADRMVWSSTAPDAGQVEPDRPRARRRPAATSTSPVGVEHQWRLEDDRGRASPAAIRGSSRRARRSSAPASSARRRPARTAGATAPATGRPPPARPRLQQRDTGAVVLLGHRQRGHADLLAEGLPERLVVPGSESIAARTAALSARLSSSDRTVAASSCCSSESATSISRLLSGVEQDPPRWYAGVPQAVISARTLRIQRLRSSSGCSRRRRAPGGRAGGEVRRVSARHLGRRRRDVAQGRAEDQRPGEVERDPYVGQPCLIAW